VSERRRAAGDRRSLNDPIGFLYFHTVELVLKAFLRSYDRPNPHSHILTDLFDECQRWGLKDDPTDIGKIVKLLDFGNSEQGLRYYPLTPRDMPDLTWTHEVVNAFVQAVASQIEARPKPVTGVVLKTDLVVGRERNPC
jgi:hypothetical protein